MRGYQISEAAKMLSTVSARILESIKNFDALPQDAVVSPKVAALILGVSERTLRRAPPVPKVKLSSQRSGFRVGSLREFVRGAGCQTVA
jgi:hypothetical protein